MDVQLEPPAGTAYFKMYTTRLVDSDIHGRRTGDVNVTTYVYVTNAKPTDPEFTIKGGKVYIVVVFDGWVGNTTRLGFSFTTDSELLSCIGQFPITGTQTKKADNHIYSIDFARTMNMYQHGGGQPVIFRARYRKEFGLLDPVQIAYRTTTIWGWNINRTVMASAMT